MNGPSAALVLATQMRLSTPDVAFGAGSAGTGLE